MLHRISFQTADGPNFLFSLTVTSPPPSVSMVVKPQNEYCILGVARGSNKLELLVYN